MLLLIDIALLALAGIITHFLVRAGRDARRRVEADAAAKLAEAGLRADGDLLGKFVARPVEGVEVVLENRTFQTRPGATEPTEKTCVARIAVPLADQIVCKVSEADLVMGPLPAAPRVRTGHAPFDDVYAIFVGSGGAAPPSGSYRAPPMASDTPWAQPALLEALLELDLLWLRAQEGRVDLVFPPLEAEDVGRAAALAIAFAKAAAGSSVPPLARGPRVIQLAWKDMGDTVGVIWGLSVFPGMMLGAVVFAPVLRNLDAERWCGSGDRIIKTSFDDGNSVSYGLACQSHPEKSLFMHWLGSAVFALGIFVLSAITVVIARRIRARSRGRVEGPER